MGDAGPQPTPEQVDELVTLVRPRQLLRAVEWLEEQHEPVCERLWDNVYKISQRAKHPRTQLLATRMLVDRFDPIPRPPAVQVETGPVTITWKSSSTTDPVPSRPHSIAPSESNGHALPSSSATDVLENL